MINPYKIKAFFIAAFIFLFTHVSFSAAVTSKDTVVAGKAYLKVNIKAVIGADINDALIVVTMDSIRVASFHTDKKNGHVDFKLPFGHVYQISVEKDGYYAKFTTIDTHIPPKYMNNKYEVNVDIELLKYVRGVDPSVLYQPLQLIIFHVKKEKFIVDEEYINSIRPDLEKFRIEYEKMKQGN